MHDFKQRLSAVVSFAFLVACFLTAAIAVATPLLAGEPTISSFKLIDTRLASDRLRPNNRGLFFEFDLSADFTPNFSWNVKQVFVFLAVEYLTPGKNEKGQIVVWDKILLASGETSINAGSIFSKYPIMEKEDKIKGLDVNLTLYWNPISTVGWLNMVSSKNVGQFKIPQY